MIPLTNSYITPEIIEKTYGLTLDDENTTQLMALIASSNNAIDSAISSHLDITTISQTPYFKQAQSIALLYFESIYRRFINAIPALSDAAYKQYQGERDNFIASLRKQTRTKSSFHCIDYEGEITRTFSKTRGLDFLD